MKSETGVKLLMGFEQDTARAAEAQPRDLEMCW